MKTVNRESFDFLKKSRKFRRLAGTELLPALVGSQDSAFAYFDGQEYEKAADTMKYLSNLLLDQLYSLEPLLQAAQSSKESWFKLNYPLKVMRLADLHLLSQSVRKELIDEGRPDLFDKTGAMHKLAAFTEIMLFFMQHYESQKLPLELQAAGKSNAQNQFSQDNLITAITKTQAKLPQPDLKRQQTDQKAQSLQAAFKTAAKVERGHSSFFFYLIAVLLILGAGWFLQLDRTLLFYGGLSAAVMALLLLIIQSTHRHGLKKAQRRVVREGAAFQQRYRELTTEESDEIDSFSEEEEPYSAFKNGRQHFSLLPLPKEMLIVRDIYVGELLREQLVYSRHGQLQQWRQFLPGRPLYLLTTFKPKRKRSFVTAKGKVYSWAAYQEHFSSDASKKRQQTLKGTVKQNLQRLSDLNPAENLLPWLGKQLLQPEMALQMLQTTEYYGRQFVDDASLSVKQDLSKDNLVGLDYLNSRFINYDQVRTQFLASLHQFRRRSQDRALSQRVLQISSALQTEPFFKGTEKTAAFKQFQKELAANAIKRIINRQQAHAQPVVVLNDLLLPGFDGAEEIKLTHLVISAKGLFALDTRRVNLKGDRYDPKTDQNLKPLRQRIITERKALVSALRQEAEQQPAAQAVVKLLLSQRSIFNLLLIVNSNGQQKQDFKIAPSDFDSGAAQTTNIGISNLRELPQHLFGHQHNDLNLTRSQMTTIANLLQHKPDVTAVESENYAFFPQIGWNFGDEPGNTAQIANEMGYLGDVLQGIDALKQSMDHLLQDQQESALFRQAAEQLDLNKEMAIKPKSLRKQI